MRGVERTQEEPGSTEKNHRPVPLFKDWDPEEAALPQV
jgi:hypothetical protein